MASHTLQGQLGQILQEAIEHFNRRRIIQPLDLALTTLAHFFDDFLDHGVSVQRLVGRHYSPPFRPPMLTTEPNIAQQPTEERIQAERQPDRRFSSAAPHSATSTFGHPSVL